jgi:hypothetical protein
MDQNQNWVDLLQRYSKVIFVILVAVGGTVLLWTLDFLFPELPIQDYSQYYEENFFQGLFYAFLTILYSLCVLSSYIAVFLAGYFLAEYRILRKASIQNEEPQQEKNLIESTEDPVEEREDDKFIQD